MSIAWRLRRRALVLPVTLAIGVLAAQPAAGETYLEIGSRGMRISALLLKPEKEATAAVILFAGGSPAQSDVCEARAPHGIPFLAAEVVTAIAGWVGQLP